MIVPPEVPTSPGAYILRVQGAKDYVGSSENMRRRVRAHANDLRRGLHHSPELQRDHDAANGNVEVVMIPTSSAEEARAREQALLNERVHTGTLYNKASDAYASQRGLKNPKSEETKKRLSETIRSTPALMQKIDTMAQIRRGTSLTDEHKVNLGEAHRTSVAAIEARKKNGELRREAITVNGVVYACAKDAADALGVTCNTVYGRINSPNFPEWRKAS